MIQSIYLPWFRAYLPWVIAYLPWVIAYLPSEAVSSNPRRWLHYRGRPDACLQFTTDASKMVFMWSPSVFHHEGIENNYEVRRFMVSSAAQDEPQFEVQYFVMATRSGQGALRTNKMQPVHRDHHRATVKMSQNIKSIVVSVWQARNRKSCSINCKTRRLIKTGAREVEEKYEGDHGHLLAGTREC